MKEKLQKEKSRQSGLFLRTAVLTPPRQHQKSSFSKNDAFKKGTVHKRALVNLIIIYVKILKKLSNVTFKFLKKQAPSAREPFIHSQELAILGCEVGTKVLLDSLPPCVLDLIKRECNNSSS
jgi:hypothetical protein